jgi:hypothetical protein
MSEVAHIQEHVLPLHDLALFNLAMSEFSSELRKISDHLNL